eukprot:650542-Rhodomonas_salina.1
MSCSWLPDVREPRPSAAYHDKQLSPLSHHSWCNPPLQAAVMVGYPERGQLTEANHQPVPGYQGTQ